MASVAGFAAGRQDSAAAQPAEQVAAADPLTAAIDAAQLRLTTVPGDWSTWAQLGSAYVEQARVTADPSYYDLADGALTQSLALRPEGNDTALTGQGALANARHDFAGARDAAEAALAVNPLQRDGLRRAGRRPDPAGRLRRCHRGAGPDARAAPGTGVVHPRLLRRRAARRRRPGPVGPGAGPRPRDRPVGESFCRDLPGAARANQGDLDDAGAQFSSGLVDRPTTRPCCSAVPGSTPRWGDEEAAVAGYQRWSRPVRCPRTWSSSASTWSPWAGTTRPPQQYAVVDTVRQLFAASGVTDDLSTALFAADHDDPVTALVAAHRRVRPPAEHRQPGRDRLGPARRRPGRRGAPAGPAGHLARWGEPASSATTGGPSRRPSG